MADQPIDEKYAKIVLALKEAGGELCGECAACGARDILRDVGENAALQEAIASVDKLEGE